MRRILLVGAVVLAVAACGGTGGSVSGASERCTRDGSAGRCEGAFASLAGTYDKIIEAEGCHTNVAVMVEVTVSVAAGTVKVKTTGPDGVDYIAEALPGSPAALTGAAAGCTNEFHVIFAAAEGEATGVEYAIQYEVP